jgi:hypothetical protein
MPFSNSPEMISPWTGLPSMLAEIGLPVVIGSPIVSFIQLITLEIIVFFFGQLFQSFFPAIS